MIQAIIYGIFLLIPFIYAPWSSPTFEVPRIIAFQRIIEILVFASLFRLKSLKKERKDAGLITAVLLFITWVTLTSIIGLDPLKSFWGNYYREDGIFTLFHLLTLFAILSLFWKRSWLKYLTYSIRASSIIVSIWSILSYIMSGGHPPILSFGHPAFLAGYLIMTLPFLPPVSIPLVLLALLSTKTAMSLVGIGTYLLISMGKKYRWSRNKILITVFITASITAILLFQFREKNRSVFDTRERIFTKALIATTSKSVAGWGWSNFDYAFEAIDFPIHYNFDLRVDKAHSTLLEIMTTTGFVGLALYAGVLYRVFKRMLRKEIPFEFFSMMLLYIVISQTNVLSVVTEVFIWTILGIIASSSPVKRAWGSR